MIIGGVIFSGACVWSCIENADSIIRGFPIPFIIWGFAVLIKGIIHLVKGLNLRKGIKDDSVSAESVFDKQDKLDIADKKSSKLFIVGFLVWWFGFTIMLDFFAIKEGKMLMLISSLAFWVAGIYMVFKNFKE